MIALLAWAVAAATAATVLEDLDYANRPRATACFVDVPKELPRCSDVEGQHRASVRRAADGRQVREAADGEAADDGQQAAAAPGALLERLVVRPAHRPRRARISGLPLGSTCSLTLELSIRPSNVPNIGSTFEPCKPAPLLSTSVLQ